MRQIVVGLAQMSAEGPRVEKGRGLVGGRGLWCSGRGCSGHITLFLFLNLSCSKGRGRSLRCSRWSLWHSGWNLICSRWSLECSGWSLRSSGRSLRCSGRGCSSHSILLLFWDVRWRSRECGGRGL